MTLNISPLDDLLSIPRRITISGYEPQAIVYVDTETQRKGGLWTSRNYYLVDAQGRVDLDREAPVWGDAFEAGSDVVFFSQKPEDGAGPDPWPNELADGLITKVTVNDQHGNSESAEVIQRFIGPGVTRRVIDQDGVKGVLFTPAGEGPFQTVVLLNGSDGGTHETRAALFASHGIQVLSLAYFNYPGLSPYISNTNLEYFGNALAWANRELNPLGGKVATSGGSRGGELSLLLPATFPDLIFGTAAFVPGAFVHSAQTSKAPEADWRDPAWLQGGIGLTNLFDGNPFAPDESPFLHSNPHFENHNRRNSVFIDAQASAEHRAAARIKVENIQGPVFLASGTDDKVWPGSFASRWVKAQLVANGHPWEVTHLDFVGAGHQIGLPDVPRVIVAQHPVSGTVGTSGGSASANQRASRESFDAVVQFFHRINA